MGNKGARVKMAGGKYATNFTFIYFVFFFKQKTAYEIKECDWSSDVCSSDLTRWAYVFLLRHGFDYTDWPSEIKKLIGEKLPNLPDGLFM